MEELFTTEKETASREVLVRLLTAFAGSGLVWVIATIRSDFFHRCGEIPGFSALKDGLGSYELLPPTGPEIAQIIREPARAAGLRYEETADRGRLDDVLQEAAAADPRSLPLLEFVLDALYGAGRDRRVLTFAAYRALGGLEGAIARRADEVVDSLPTDIQEALPAVLRALTTVRPGDEAVTARPAPLTEVASTPARLALVDALVGARLLVTDEDVAGHVFVRVAHEALLSRWPRASDIVNANRNFLETRARVAADAHRWHADNCNQELLLPSGKRLAEGEELLLSRREEVDDQIVEYIDASLRAQAEREEKDRQAERALIEASEAATRTLEREAERLEREAERRNLAAKAASRLARRTRYAAIVAIGAGSFGWCRRVRRIQRAAGSKPASRASANERGQGKVGRAAGACGTRPGPAQPVSFAFTSFAANRSQRRYRGRDLAGVGSAADWHILRQTPIHRRRRDCALQGFVGPLSNEDLPPPCRRNTRNFQSERRPHCHLILRQDRTHLGPVQRR